VVTPAVVRLFSHVCPTAPALPVQAVQVTQDGPKQERITGPTIIQTEVWYMDGPNTRASGTIWTPTMGDRWPIMAGSR
jgi:hypothetical protein